MSGAVGETEAPRRRRWHWAVGTVVGVGAAGAVYVIIGMLSWFEAGGTLGGFGASASDDVDWGQLQRLGAATTWIPVLVAGAVPLAWAWSARTHATTSASRRRGTVAFTTIAGVLTVLSILPPVKLLVDRATALEPDAAVVAALEQVAGEALDRDVERLEEQWPWVVTYRARSAVDLRDVAAAAPDEGRWLCSQRPDTLRWFESADGDWSVLVDGDGSVTLRAHPHGPVGADRPQRCR